MMKLSVLFLLAMLGLSSASLLNTVNSTEHLDVSLLDPDLEEEIPEMSGNDSMLTDEALLVPPIEPENRHSQPLSFNLKGTALEWQTWRGSLPKGTVSIYSFYTRRQDYVCKYRCEAGFYNPRKGRYCYYPYAGRAYRGYPFQILVNKDQFEMLEWKPSSSGKLPHNSVGTCSGGDIYVGMFFFGLGKVSSRYMTFYFPWKGKEHRFQKGYQVLTINKTVVSEHVTDVKYKIDSAKIFRYPPETMRTSTISNYACSTVEKTATLSKTTTRSHTWDTSHSLTVGVTSTFSFSIPLIVSGNIELSAETTVEFSKGTSLTESYLHSVSVKLSVPPNRYCRIQMVGYNYKADIPYTARLTRSYSNGKSRSIFITGMYRGVQVGEVRAIVDRCAAIPDTRPCR